MALQKQVLSFNFSQGVDTKTDPKSVVAGKLLTLENGVFISPKRIKKRNGYQELYPAVGIPQTGTISTGQSLAVYQNELLSCDQTTMYSYDVSGQAWISKGPFTSCTLTQSSVIRNTFQQTGQDSAVHSTGLQVFAWEDSSGGSRYNVIDGVTGQVLVPSTQILSTAIKPKLLTIANQILLLYVNTADSRIYGATISVSAPTAALAPVAITASGTVANALNSTAPNYDAAIVNTQAGPAVYIGFNNNAAVSQGTTIFSLNAATPTSVVTFVNIASEVSSVVSIFGDLFQQGPVLAYWNGTSVKVRAYDWTLTTLLGSGTVETLANVVSITGVSTSSSALNLRLFYSVSAAQTYNYLTRQNTVTGSYAIGTAAPYLRSVAIFGKAFLYGSTGFVPLAYQSPLQPTYFVADHTGNIISKMLYGVGGGVPTRASNGSVMLTEAVPLAGGTQFEIAALQAGELTVQSGAKFTLTGVTSAVLNFFDTQNSYQDATLGKNLHIGGGFIGMYDGVSPVEHGFHLYPEPITVPNPGGSFSYAYAVCYEWMDNLGQTHRSAPSVTVTQAQANAIDGTHTVTVTIPTLRLTAKTGARSPVNCVVYRTQNLGTVFYQTSSILTPTQSTTTADTVTFVDQTTDAALVGNALLYSQSLSTQPVLENIAPNATSSMCVHQNRIFALDSTSPLGINYSKECVPGSPVEFSAGSLTLNVDPRGGNCTAVASLDDKLIVFKSNSIFFHTGNGPDSTGGQNNFSDSLFITSDVGCINPRSVVLVSLPNGDVGLMFQSAKGIYLLDRSLQIAYVGADVENIVNPLGTTAAIVTSAQQIQNTHQVRFCLNTGQALVYDDMFRQWSVFTNHNAIDSVIWQGQFTFLSPIGAVFQETPGQFSDAGSFIKLKVITSWLQFAGVQGFQRIYKLLVLGEYASAHNLLVQLAYDFNGAAVQQDLITPSTGGTYGSDANYGSGSPYGGSFPLYEWRIFPTQQKCEAIQIQIEDVNSGTVGEAMSLSAVTLEVGLKKGAFKLPSSSSYG